MQYFQSHRFKEGDCDFGEIEVGQTIGNGNSSVFAIRFKHNPAAMKEIIIKNQEQAKQVANEIKMMKSLSATNHYIIKYLGSFTTVRQLGLYNLSQMAYIVMERASMSLEQLIQHKIRSQDIFVQAEILKIMRILIQTLCFLQKSGIAHCDIKPQNILIMDINTLDIKLCDIGSCRTTKESTEQATLVGTVPFLAPELIRDFTKDRVVNNPFKSDVFSLGLCFLYLLLFKKFKSAQRLKVNQNVYRQIITEWIQQAKEIYFRQEIIGRLLDMLLQFDEKKRISFIRLDEFTKEALLEHGMKKTQQIKDAKKKLEQLYIEKGRKPISSYNSIPQEARKAPDLRHTSSFGFRLSLNPILEGPTTLKYKRKVVPKKLQNISISHSRGIFSPLTAKRKSTNTAKTNSTTIDDSPKLKPWPLQKSQSNPQTCKQRVILINSENMEEVQKAEVRWGQKLVILDSCYYNVEGVRQMTLKVSAQSDLQIIINNIKDMETLSSLVVDMRGYASQSGFKFIALNAYKAINHLSLILDSSSVLHYNNLFLIWISENIRRLNISLRRSAISPEDVCEMISWTIQCLQLESLSLNLEELKINEKGNKTLIQTVSKAKKLRFLKLNLSNNSISYTKQHPWQLPKNIEKLILEYSHNDMRSALNNFSNCLPHVRQSLRELVLNLEDTALSSKQVNFLFNSLTKLHLDTLSIKLGYNQIDDSASKYISKTMTLLSTISNLELGFENTNITQQGLMSIVHVADKMFQKKLKTAIFSYHRLNTKEAITETLISSIKSQVKVDIVFQDWTFRLYLKGKLSPQIKGRKIVSKKTYCEKLHKTGQSIKHYACITCTENNPIYRNIYLCEYCSDTCDHLGHVLVPLYKDVECGCLYLNCKSDINQVPCSSREGLMIQKGSRCLACEKNSLCTSCSKTCKNSHPESVIDHQHMGRFRCCQANPRI